MDKAKDIIMLNEMWQNTDSDVILNNIEKLLAANGCTTFTDRWKRLADITSSTKYAVYAWLNRGRKDVKIPFLKLCMIAEEYNIEIEKFFIGGNFMFTKKFAITHTIGNNEEVLKTFTEDEKDQALAYGAKAVKEITQGVIACILTQFDKDDKMRNDERRVFEVWTYEG